LCFWNLSTILRASSKSLSFSRSLVRQFSSGQSTKIFVGSLAWRTTTDTLRETFSRYGRVLDARIVNDRDTGRSRGFGFVTFSDPSEAESALSHNSQEIDGRRVTVNTAKENAPRGGRQNIDDFDSPL